MARQRALRGDQARRGGTLSAPLTTYEWFLLVSFYPRAVAQAFGAYAAAVVKSFRIMVPLAFVLARVEFWRVLDEGTSEGF